MTYDRTDAREHARNALAARLAAVRAELGNREALRDEEARLLWEIEGLDEDLDARAPVRLPDGAKLSLASPCKERWDMMVGDDRVRHCSRCDKSVYNLSGMTSAQIGAFLSAQGEEPCVRFFKRKDGTMLTADCPVGRPKKVALRVVTALGVALGSSVAGLALSSAPPPPPCNMRHPTNVLSTRVGETTSPAPGTEPTYRMREVAGGLPVYSPRR